MPRVSIFRDPFNADSQFVVKRAITLSGEPVQVGSVFDKSRVSTRRLRQLFEQRALAYPHETGRDRSRAPHPTRRLLRENTGRAAMGAALPPAAVKAPAAPVGHPIPEGWQYLPWNGLLSLASKFSKVRVNNKRQAFASITAEVARRARAA